MSNDVNNVIPFPVDRIKKRQTQEEVNAIVEKALKKKLPDSKQKVGKKEQEKSNVKKINCDVLQIEMDDGSWWEIPVKIIAENRANAAANSTDGDEVKVYEKIFKETSESEEILVDWVESSLDWQDISKYATIVRPPRNTNYDEAWKSGMKRVIKNGKKD